MFYVSQSKILQWRRCKLQFHYAHVIKIQPKVKERPLYFGSTVHKMLQADAEGKSPTKVLAEIAERDVKLFQTEREMFARLVDDIMWIFRAYKSYWAKQPFKFIELEGRKAEVPFEVQVDKGITVKGTIDGAVKHGSGAWLLENKCHQQIPNDDHRWRNLQSAVYVTIASKIKGWPKFEGTCWNYLRSKSPGRPTVLKTGGLSEAKSLDSLPEVVLDTIEEHRLDPKKYQALLQAQEANLPTWFQRTYQPLDPAVVNKLWGEFITTAHEMADWYEGHPNNSRPPRSIDLHCSWCSYEKLCRAELQGNDVEWLMEREYEPNEYNG